MTALASLLIEAQPGFACGEEDAGGVFQFRMHNVSKTSDLVLEKRRRVPWDAHKRIDHFLVRAGDVLFNATNSPDGVGKSVLVPQLDEPAVFSNHFLRLRPDEKRLDARYLWRWLQFQFHQGVFWGMTRRWVNQATVSREDLLALDLPLPPLAEQRRIAAILDQADALRAKRRQVLAHLDTLPQSIFHDMFGRHFYPYISIGEVTECLDFMRVPIKESDREPGDIPYYGANGRQGWIDRAIFDEPLVLVAEDGGHFDTPERGVAYRIDGPAWVNNHAHVLRPGPSIDVEFLHQALRHYDFRPYISGSTRSKLTQKQLKSAKIQLPPLDLQRQFAERVRHVSARRRIEERLVRKNDELIASLQSRAFRGEL